MMSSKVYKCFYISLKDLNQKRRKAIRRYMLCLHKGNVGSVTLSDPKFAYAHSGLGLCIFWNRVVNFVVPLISNWNHDI